MANVDPALSDSGKRFDRSFVSSKKTPPSRHRLWRYDNKKLCDLFQLADALRLSGTTAQPARFQSSTV